MKIDLIDRSFYPDLTSSREQTESPIQWDRTCSQGGPVVISDLCLDFVRFHKKRDKKIAWLIEPEAISPRTYEWIKRDGRNHYDYILCNHKKYCDDEKVLYYFFGGTWIKPEDRRIYEKTKDLSITASNKNWTQGHELRHRVTDKYKDDLDIFGTGYNFVPNKADSLKDYRFHVVIENSKEEGYVTEKLIDCFLTGSVPIYWGSTESHIKEHFNLDGMILFSDFNDLENIINNINLGCKTTYEKMSNAIQDNFERAKKYVSAEHWIWDNLKERIFV